MKIQNCLPNLSGYRLLVLMFVTMLQMYHKWIGKLRCKPYLVRIVWTFAIKCPPLLIPSPLWCVHLFKINLISIRSIYYMNKLLAFPFLLASEPVRSRNTTSHFMLCKLQKLTCMNWTNHRHFIWICTHALLFHALALVDSCKENPK